MTETAVASPCVRNCCLDDDAICLGCHRSIEEIIAWGTADDDARRAILQRVAERALERERRRSARDF